VNETYDYLTIRVDTAAVPDVRRHVLTEGRARVEAAGGVLVGVWVGGTGIGWSSEELVVMAGWTARPGDAAALFAGAPGVSAVAAERLAATARPAEPAVLAPGGVVAHRWFELDVDDWDEFLRLSVEAWPTFESLYETEILGFFRAPDAGGTARVLLLTRYSSLAEWERSRQATRATEGAGAEAGRRFLRRRELTRSSIVRIAPLAGDGG
jgi:hypothetical protein